MMVVARNTKSKRSFLLLECGGTGSQSGDSLDDVLRRRFPNIPVERVQLDLDLGEKSSARHQIKLNLTPENAREILANPEKFGAYIPAAVKNIGYLLSPMELESGARTTPGMTQVCLAYHMPHVRRVLTSVIGHLKKHGKVNRILPIILSSTGGGTGSALSVLLPMLLADPTERACLLSGLGTDVLETPVLAVAFPFSYAKNYAVPSQAARIYSNQYVWQMNTDRGLSRQEIQYILSIGYSNDSGTVLDTSDSMVRVLAASTLQFITNYDYFKGRWTDSVPNANEASYQGTDLLEDAFPEEKNTEEEEEDN